MGIAVLLKLLGASSGSKGTRTFSGGPLVEIFKGRVDDRIF